MGVTRDVFYDPKLVAVLPMGFCYPGTGKSGDLPPRPECAPAWRESLLQRLRHVEVTLVIGQYAQAYHLDEKKTSLTENVRGLAQALALDGSAAAPEPEEQHMASQEPVVRDGPSADAAAADRGSTDAVTAAVKLGSTQCE